jgi:hypothetical protein
VLSCVTGEVETWQIAIWRAYTERV